MPQRGEVWLVALGAGRAGEPAKTSPAVVISDDGLNADAPEDLVVVIPLSSSASPSGLRIDVPATQGIDRPSRVICRAIRAVSLSRCQRRIARVDAGTMAAIESAVLVVLGLDRRALDN